MTREYYTAPVPPEKVKDIIKIIDPNGEQHAPKEEGSCSCGTFHTRGPTLDSICDYSSKNEKVDVLYRHFYGSDQATLFIKANELDLIKEELKRLGLEFDESKRVRPLLPGL